MAWSGWGALVTFAGCTPEDQRAFDNLLFAILAVIAVVFLFGAAVLLKVVYSTLRNVKANTTAPTRASRTSGITYGILSIGLGLPWFASVLQGVLLRGVLLQDTLFSFVSSFFLLALGVASIYAASRAPVTPAPPTEEPPSPNTPPR